MYLKIMFILSLFIALSSAQNTNSTCSYCENLINLLKYEININNSTIIDLINLIKDVCSRVFGPGGRECQLIIDNVEHIIDLIYNNTNSTQICKDLYLC